MRIFAGALYLLLAPIHHTHAILVSNATQLRNAINTANNSPQIIEFTQNITLNIPLPAITNTYTIDGKTFVLDGNNSFRGFIVTNGNPTIQNITIQQGLAQGGAGGDVERDDGGTGGGGLGAGGALFIGDNAGTVTISTFKMDSNTAQGGDSPDPVPNPGGSSAGGGGGGIGGNGGEGDRAQGNNRGGGGGGGGLITGEDGGDGNNNSGGVGGGSGATGADPNPPTPALPGGYGGGGGGAADGTNGAPAQSSIGGFGGGGGGGADNPNNRNGSNGGFGAGGGGGAQNSTSAGTSTFAGGAGANGTGQNGGQGGGGAALGGAIFIGDSSTLKLITNIQPFSSSTLTPGTGANSGQSFGQDIFLASGGTLQLEIPTAATVIFTNPIQSDSINNTGGVEKLGIGTLSFASLANTFRGTLTVTAGTLRVNQAANFGNVNSLHMNGGTLNITTSFASALPVLLTTSTNAFDINPSQAFTLSGIVSGSGACTKLNTGNLVLSAINTYTGQTTINGGNLTLSGSGTLGNQSDLDIQSGTFTIATGAGSKIIGNLTGSGSINLNNNTLQIPSGNYTGAISGTGTIQKISTGLLTLGGSSNYSGGTTISAGTLSIGADNHIGMGNIAISNATLRTTASLNSSKAITITGAGTFNVTTGSTNLTGVISGGALTKTGMGTLVIGGNNGYNGGTNILGGTLSVADDTHLGTGNISINNATLFTTQSFNTSKNISLPGPGMIEVANTTQLGVSGNISGTSLVKEGMGTLVLSGNNNYSGGTTIMGGVLSVSANTHLGTGSISIHDSTLQATGGFNSSKAVTLIGSGMIDVTTGNLALSGVVSGTGTLIKLGAGKLTLSGNNSFSGGITISQGTLSVGQSMHLGAASGGIAMGNAILETTGNLSSSKTINLIGAGVIDVQSGIFTADGVISGSNPLNKQGPGELVLTQTNLYTGDTLINDGTLTASSVGNLGSGSGITMNDATLKTTANITTNKTFDLQLTETINVASGVLQLDGVLSGSGGLTKSGPGELILTQNNPYSAATQIFDGVVTISNTNNLGTASGINLSATIKTSASFFLGKQIFLTGAGTFQVDGAATILTLTQPIINSNPLTKTGIGELDISGNNSASFTGNININSGTLSVANAANLGSGTADLSIGTATFRAKNGFTTNRPIILLGAAEIQVDSGTLIAGGIVSGSNDLIKVGPGKLTLTNNNTYAGDARILAGTLSIGSLQNLGSGSNIVITNATLETTGSINTTKAIDLTGNGTIDVTTGSVTLNGVVGGTGNLLKAGNGTLILANSNNYNGITNVFAGRLSIGNVNNLGAGNLQLSGGTLEGNQTFILNKNIALTAASAVAATTGNTMTISGDITGNFDLSILGPGKITLTGSNSYAQTIIENGGTLSVGNDSQLGTAALILNGGTLEANTSFSTAKTITLGATSTISTLAGVTFISNGAIGQTAASSLVKSGPGELVVNGLSSFSGDTQITDGVLSISNVNQLGGGNIQLGLATLKTSGVLVTPKTISLTGNGTIDVNSGSLALGGQISGPHSLTKNGSGELLLNVASSFTGSTNINAGKLTVSAEDRLGGGNITLGAATLNTTGSFVTSKAIALTGNGTIEVTTGPLALNGQISGAQSLTKSGSGELILAGSNNYSGGTTVDAGIVTISANNNLGSANLTLNGGSLNVDGSFITTKTIALPQTSTISVTTGKALTANGMISGTGGLTKAGPGTLILGANNNYSGLTNVAAGRVSIGDASNLGSANLQLSGGTLEGNQTFTLNKNFALTAASGVAATAGNTMTISGNITGNFDLSIFGPGKITLTGTNSYSKTIVENGGTLSVGDDSHLGVADLILKGGTLEANNTFSTSKPVTLEATSMISVLAGVTFSANGNITESVASGLIKSGPGELVLGGTNSYSGVTTINDGTLFISNANNLGSGNITLAAATFKTTGSVALTKAIGLTGNGIIDVVSGALSLNGQISGPHSLIKNGSGELILGVANNFTGTTIVNAGKLTVSAEDRLGGGNINLGAATLNTTGSFATNKSIALTGNGTLEVTTGPLTLNGQITGSNSLTKTGSGKLTLTGNNTYSGGTNISAGELSVGIASNLGAAAGGLNIANATLETTGSFNTSKIVAITGSSSFDITTGQVSLAGAISGTGSLVKQGPGILVLSGNNAYTGLTDVQDGRLSIGDASHLGSGNLQLSGGTLEGNQTFTLAKSMTLTAASSVAATTGNTLTISGSITGGFGLSILGPGKITLTGSNAYTTTTIENGGTLSVGDDSQLGTAALFLNGGTLEANTSFTTAKAMTMSTTSMVDTLSGVAFNANGDIDGAGGLTKNGPGELVLGGTNSYSGLTIINDGTLFISNANNLGSGNITLAAATFKTTGSVVLTKTIGLTGNGIIDVMGGALSLNGQISGTHSLTKEGFGELILGVANNFTGATVINAGKLTVSAEDRMGGGNLTLGAATLNTTGSFATSKSIALTGNGTIEVITGPLNLNGQISGPHSLTKTGNGELVLGVANSFTGTTTIDAGKLTIGAENRLGGGGIALGAATLKTTGSISTSKAVTLTGNGFIEVDTGTLSLSGQINGAHSLTKEGSGELILSANNFYSGGTSVNAGTLTISNENNLGSGNLTLSSATLNVNGSFATTKTIAIPATATISVTNGNIFTANGMLSGSGGFIKSEPGTLVVGVNNNYTGLTDVQDGRLSIGDANHLGSGNLQLSGGTLEGNQTFTLAKNMMLTAASSVAATTGNTFTISGNITGSFGLSVLGSGKITLTGSNAYTTTTIENGGTLSVGDDSQLGTAALFLNGGTLETNTSFSTAKAMTMSTTSMVDTLSGVTFNANGDIDGAGGLIKNGPGEFILNGSNTYGGDTTINAGTLTIENANNLGGGNINLGAATLKTTAILGLTKTITLSSDGMIEVDSGVFTLNGPLMGPHAFTKTGPGELVFTQQNNYSGPTTIENGELTISADDQLGLGNVILGAATIKTTAPFTTSRTISLTADGTIDVQTGPLTLGNAITGGFGFIKNGPGGVFLDGSNTFSGTLQINAGEVFVSANQNLGAGGVDMNGATLTATSSFSTSLLLTLASNNQINVAASETLNWNGPITGTGTIDKIGNGALHLAGANSYSGQLNIETGIVQIDSSIGDIHVKTQGSLRGTGSAGNLLNDGLVFPGTSLGTLVVNGNYTQSPMGTYEVEIDPAGNTDLIQVTGTASLQGTLLVLPQGNTGLFLEGTEYTVLTAANISPQALVISENSPLEFELSYPNNTSVLLTIPRDELFLPVDQITDPNAKNTANYLLSCQVNQDPDALEVLTALTLLNPSELTVALDQISHERFGTILYSQANVYQHVASLFSQQMQQLAIPKTCSNRSPFQFWVAPFGFWTHQGASQDRMAYRADQYGLATGLRIFGGPHFNWQVGFAFTKDRLHWSPNLGYADISTYHIVANGLFHWQGGFVEFGVEGANNHVSSKRKISFPSVNRKAKSRFGRFGITANIKTAVNVFVRRVANIQPELSLYYTYIYQNAFKETDAKTLNLFVRAIDYQLLRGILGFNLYRTYKLGSLCFTPQFFLGWMHDHTLSSNRFKASLFEYCPCDTFKVTSYKKSFDAGVFRALFQFTKGFFESSLKYQYTAGNDYDEHLTSVELGVSF